MNTNLNFKHMSKKRKALFIVIPLAVILLAAVVVNKFITNQNYTPITSSATTLTGRWIEKGSGTTTSGASTMTSVRTGILFSGNKMYIYQVGVYDSTDQDIINDKSGMRNGAYATFTMDGSKLTVMDEQGVKRSECKIDGTTVTCGNTDYIKQ